MNNFMEMLPGYVLLFLFTIGLLYALYDVYWKWPRESKPYESYDEDIDY